MRYHIAIESLQALWKEAADGRMQLKRSDTFASWKYGVRSGLNRALGVDHHLTQSLVGNRYSLNDVNE